MNRRQFLRLGGTGLVASATMAEAGMFAEFLAWLQKKPAWSFPKPKPTFLGADFDLGYYSIEWPVVSREWTFGVYASDLLKLNKDVKVFVNGAEMLKNAYAVKDSIITFKDPPHSSIQLPSIELVQPPPANISFSTLPEMPKRPQTNKPVRLFI